MYTLLILSFAVLNSDAVSALGCLHRVDVGSVADISKVHATSIFMIDVCRAAEESNNLLLVFQPADSVLILIPVRAHYHILAHCHRCLLYLWWGGGRGTFPLTVKGLYNLRRYKFFCTPAVQKNFRCVSWHMRMFALYTAHHITNNTHTYHYTLIYTILHYLPRSSLKAGLYNKVCLNLLTVV
jgi:hypothetical protein